MVAKKSTAKSSKPGKAAKAATTKTVSKSEVKRQVKPATLREKAIESANKKPKTRKVRGAVSVASRPFVWVGRLVARILRPFAFVLIPFKTRPVRAVGRFLASVLLLKYFRNSWKELKLVEWPDARQTFQLTVAVFIFAVFFGAIISVVDFGLDKAFQKLIIK